MAISTGTYTVGGSGTDYPGVTGLDDAIADTIAYTGALNYVVSGDVDWTTDVTFNQNGHPLTITSDTDPLGTVSRGWWVTIGADIDLIPTDISNVIVEYLKFRSLNVSPDTIIIGDATKPYYTFNRCIFNNVDIQFARPSRTNDSVFTNNVHYESLIEIYANQSADTLLTIENNFFYSTQRSIVLRQWNVNGFLEKIVIRDNVLFRDFGDAIYLVPSATYISYPQGYNNATQNTAINDVTWSASSGNVPNVDVTTNIQSIDITSDVYGRLTISKFGYTPGSASLGNAGIAPTYAGSTDAAGNPRPGEDGNYSIGAFEQQYDLVGEIPIFKYGSVFMSFGKTIYGATYPNNIGLSLHTNPTQKVAYVETERLHGTTDIAWKSKNIKQGDRDIAYGFWETVLSSGKYAFTVIDHKKRMLFETSLPVINEHWKKMNGGLYALDYNMQSAVPWTLPVYGAFFMISNNLKSHLLNDDELTLGDGVLVDYYDTSYLEYIETNDAAVDNIKCVLDPEKKIGFVSTDSANHLKTYSYDTGADFTPEDVSGQAYEGYQIALDTTNPNRLVLVASGSDGVTVHVYSDSAVITSAQDKATTFARAVIIDTSRNIVFVGEVDVGGPTLESYEYYPLTDGDVIGSQIDATANDANSATFLCIDIEKKLLFLIHDSGADSYSYDSSGDTLTYKDNANAYTSTGLNGAVVDTVRLLFFHASDSGLYVYSYNSSGTFSAALSSVTAYDFIEIEIDTVNRIIYATAKTDGLFVYRYSADGTTLTLRNSDDQGGVYAGCGIDTTNNILLSTIGTAGVYSYQIGRVILRQNGYALKLTGTSGAPALVGASSTIDWSDDLVQHSISMFAQFRTSDDLDSAEGIDIIKLTNSTDDISIRYEYYSAGVNIFRVRVKNDVTTSYYGLVTRSITANTWYDIGFGYDAETESIFLYVRETDLTSFNDLFEGSTSLDDYMDIFTSVTNPVDSWTGIEMLSEIAVDSIDAADTVHLQNPMIMNGAMSPFDFNTLRRLCFMWNSKTEIYPK